MRAEPGPDERRVRHLLDRLGARPIGHPAPQGSLMTDTPAHRKGAPRMPDWWRTHTTATPPAADPAPEPEPDWWDALYADTDSDSDSFGQDPADRHPDSRWAPQPDYWPRPHIPAALTPNPDHVAAAISPKTRAALYNASAAERRVGPRPVRPTGPRDRRLRHLQHGRRPHPRPRRLPPHRACVGPPYPPLVARYRLGRPHPPRHRRPRARPLGARRLTRRNPACSPSTLPQPRRSASRAAESSAPSGSGIATALTVILVAGIREPKGSGGAPGGGGKKGRIRKKLTSDQAQWTGVAAGTLYMTAGSIWTVGGNLSDALATVFTGVASGRRGWVRCRWGLPRSCTSAS